MCTVLWKFESAGLTLHEKCEFGVNEMKSLGHKIIAQGIEAKPDTIKGIINMPEPHNVEGVKHFIGMVNYVGKFCPHLPSLTKPLRDLLKNDSTWSWDMQQKKTFEDVMKELSYPTV